MLDRVELFRGDITTLKVDAIVNAANPQLTPGGAVGLAIHRAAGPELKAACSSLMRSCNPGDAVITGAYQLSAKYVIHAVGASWHGDEKGASEQLARAYRRCFALAEQHLVRTIAFPAISCGLYSYPARAAARVALTETAAALERLISIDKVIFALFTDDIYDAFSEALDDLESGGMAAALQIFSRPESHRIRLRTACPREAEGRAPWQRKYRMRPTR